MFAMLEGNALCYLRWGSFYILSSQEFFATLFEASTLLVERRLLQTANAVRHTAIAIIFMKNLTASTTCCSEAAASTSVPALCPRLYAPEDKGYANQI